jgi:hypothetical protein
MELDEDGDLMFFLGSETLRHRKPHVYQQSGGARRKIAGRYVRSGARGVRFEIGAWDRTLPLVIDPVVSYGTFLGGNGVDGAFSLTLDSAGNIYVAGITASSTFSTAGFAPVGKFSGASDAFVIKLNPQGTAIEYATYLGGSDEDTAMAVAVDAQGNAYVTGGTTSNDFPVTTAAFQPRFGGRGGSSLPPFSRPAGDGFVAKLSPTGSLVYSSYLGGTDKDQGYGIAVDASGAAFVAGATSSPDFPVTAGVLQPVRHGSSDIFVARVSPGRIERELRVHSRAGLLRKRVRRRHHFLRGFPGDAAGFSTPAHWPTGGLRRQTQWHGDGPGLRYLPGWQQRHLRIRHSGGCLGLRLCHRRDGRDELPDYRGGLQ